MWIFPLLTAIISSVFALAMVRQYAERRHPAYLAWAAALLMFSLAATCDFVGSYSGWTALTAKLYYLSGATTAVGFLALGTLYLLAPKAVAHVWLALMLGASATAVVLLTGAGIDAERLASATEPGWQALDRPGLLTALAITINSVGTLIVVAGAIYSAIYRRFPLANVLIAAGALIAASGGTLTRLGHYEYQSIGQGLGIIVIFIGFLLTQAASKRKHRGSF